MADNVIEHPTAKRPDALIMNPPGVVGMIADYTDCLGVRVSRTFAVAGALAIVATATQNRYVVNPWATPLNLYIAMFGPSGSGKDDPGAAADHLLGSSGMVETHFGSASSLIEALSIKKRHSLLYVVDEFGRQIATANNPNNSHQYELVRRLMEFFSGATKSCQGLNVRDKDAKVPRFHGPFLNIMAMSTLERFTENLRSAEVLDGYLNRYIVLTIEDLPARKADGVRAVLSPALHRQLGMIVDAADPEHGGDGVIEIGQGVYNEIRTTDEARHLLNAFSEEADAARTRGGEVLGAVYARAFEHAVRVSGVIAVGDCANPSGAVQLSGEHARYGIALSRYSCGRLAEIVGLHVADSEEHRVQNELIAFAKKVIGDPAGDGNNPWQASNECGEIPNMQIVRRCRRIKADVRKKALATLVESGMLEMEDEGTGGRPKRVYRLGYIDE